MTADLRWYEHAACQGDAPDWDEPTAPGRTPNHVKRLTNICNNLCPVRDACLQDALQPGRRPLDTVRAGIHFDSQGRTRGSDIPTPRRRPHRQPAPCGTESGAHAHRRRKEKVCESCRRAERVASAERALRGGGRAA
jgi:hypothetical protein